MSIIVLPSTPLPRSATPKPLDFGAWQQPIAGGTITRLDRLGNRFAMDVALPRLKPEPDGRLWVSKLNQAIGGDVQMTFPQPGLVIGAPTGQNVHGGGQLGSSISVMGGGADYLVRDGQFLNLFDTSGNVYLYHATADTNLVAGVATNLPLWPNLRASPANASLVSFAPAILGMLSGNQSGWTLERAGTRGLQFTITERR